MPYCPSCRSEYRAEISRCLECDVDLVDSLAEETMGTEGEELVELASFPNVSEAEMVRELLEDNGIATDLRGEADPIGGISGAEPTTLLVVEKDFTRAKELYDAFFAGEGQPGENAVMDPDA